MNLLLVVVEVPACPGLLDTTNGCTFISSSPLVADFLRASEGGEGNTVVVVAVFPFPGERITSSGSAVLYDTPRCPSPELL